MVSNACLAALILAQVGYSAETIEVMVARADVIVRASVAEFATEPLPNNRAWFLVTLEVEETLKGKPPEHLTFAEHSLASDRRFEGWKKAGRELLVFFMKHPRYKPGEKDASARFPLDRYSYSDAMFRLGPAAPEEEPISPQPPALFTNSLEILEGPDAILEGTRRVTRAMGERTGEFRTHRTNMPRRVMEWGGRSGDVNTLTMLVGPELEALAREMILSPATVLSRKGNSKAKREREIWLDGFWEGRLAAAMNDDERREVRAARQEAVQSVCNHLRVAGAQALRHFKSEENLTLLRSFLKDEVVQVRKAAARPLEKVTTAQEKGKE